MPNIQITGVSESQTGGKFYRGATPHFDWISLFILFPRALLETTEQSASNSGG